MNKSRLAMPQDQGVREIISRFGGATKVANILRLHRTNIHKWKVCIPADHAITLWRYSKRYKLGIKLEELRPDLFAIDITSRD